VSFFRKNVGINAVPEEDGDGQCISIDFRHMTSDEITELTNWFWLQLEHQDPIYYQELMRKLKSRHEPDIH